MNEKLKSHFLGIYCVIVADKDVNPKELEAMYKIGREHYGLSSEEINEAVLSGGTAFYKPDTAEEKIAYLYDLALIAWADDQIQEEERVLLREYALKFDVDEEEVETVVDILLHQAKEKASIEEVYKALENA